MPPKRSEFSQKLAKQEGRIILALDDIKTGRINSLRAAAKLYDIPFSTPQRRAVGISSRVDKYHHRQKLTQLDGKRIRLLSGSSLTIYGWILVE